VIRQSDRRRERQRIGKEEKRGSTTMQQRVFDGKGKADDLQFEQNLRPRSFDEFVGQTRIVENLKIYVEAARRRGDVLDHILFSGLPGLGKTTLAHLVAREIGADFKASSGPVLERPGDLAGILTNLQEGDVFFIDEVHRLPNVVEEYLYAAMEDFAIDIMIDQGPSARSIKIELPRFTLIGATTREGLLTGPFRARFGVLEKLEPYPPEDLQQIIARSARILKVLIEDGASRFLAERSRGTPRIANRLLRRIRDVALVTADGVITEKVTLKGLRMLGIDERGLELLDRKILETIIHYGGGPVGLKTIAMSVGEEEGTIEEVYEPFLIQQGLLLKTPRGRKVSEAAYRHMGKEIPQAFQRHLF
jgi:Holliday junction DNA helicase RuvB